MWKTVGREKYKANAVEMTPSMDERAGDWYFEFDTGIWPSHMCVCVFACDVLKRLDY